LATLYVAKKYIVPHLCRACVNFLETSLTAKNACLLLSQSRLFEEQDLQNHCWDILDSQVSNNSISPPKNFPSYSNSADNDNFKMEIDENETNFNLANASDD
jgi:hypothetical protein